MQQVGPARVAELARVMGVGRASLDPVMSLALGTSPVTLREMVARTDDREWRIISSR
jgi:penicillin-binding protein 1A